MDEAPTKRQRWLARHKTVVRFGAVAFAVVCVVAATYFTVREGMLWPWLLVVTACANVYSFWWQTRDAEVLVRKHPDSEI